MGSTTKAGTATSFNKSKATQILNRQRKKDQKFEASQGNINPCLETNKQMFCELNTKSYSLLSGKLSQPGDVALTTGNQQARMPFLGHMLSLQMVDYEVLIDISELKYE